MKWWINSIALAFLFVTGCKTDDTTEQSSTVNKYLEYGLALPNTPYNYSHPSIPNNVFNPLLEAQDNTPSDNPITDAGATLGRVLFYDNNLSLNKSISCSSCHIQEFGFGDTSALSIGFEGGHTRRTSMRLANARFYANGHFFWDERANTLEDQVIMPMLDPIEMGMTETLILRRVDSIPYYKLLFQEAFDTPEPTIDLISKALSQFVRSIVSYQSKFDEGLALTQDMNASFPNFTSSENLGKTIFNGSKGINCSGCHFTNLMVSDNPRNNGTIDPNDQGVYENNPQNHLMNAFKAPSLRNVALSNHFMHNGSLNSLEEVVLHYSEQLTDEDGSLDEHLKDQNGPIHMNLNEIEKAALVDFLNTLTDQKVISDAKFSDPFITR